MKSIRIILPVFALMFAFAGAFASMNAVNISAKYFNSATPAQCVTGQVENACTLTSPTNAVRCTIISSGEDAFSTTGSCSTAIYKPE